MNNPRLSVVAFGLLATVCGTGPGGVVAQESSLLTYALSATPGDQTLDRMPSTNPHPRQYKETFDFTVSDTKRTDYKGSAPSCKTYDIEVFRIEGSARIPVWKWSAGRHFCTHVTAVNIPAGGKWQESALWEFKAADVKDGEYTAIATFVPTGDRSATTMFKITSVQ